MKKLSLTEVESLPVLAMGGTASVYVLSEQAVVKLFNQGLSREYVQHEQNTTDLVHREGIPVAEVLDFWEWEERYALVIKRHHGPSLMDLFGEERMLCHFDFHRGNIIMGTEGPVIIDWLTSKSASPWLDVANTSITLAYDPLPHASKEVLELLNTVRKALIEAYEESYRKDHPGWDQVKFLKAKILTFYVRGLLNWSGQEDLQKMARRNIAELKDTANRS